MPFWSCYSQAIMQGVLERRNVGSEHLSVINPEPQLRLVMTFGNRELAETARRIKEWKTYDPNIDAVFLIRKLAHSPRLLPSRIQAAHRIAAVTHLVTEGIPAESIAGVRVLESGQGDERRFTYQTMLNQSK